MLSKYQLDFYKLIGWFYGYLYEVPVRFDEKSLKVYLLPKRKWYPWLIGIGFVFILWLNCVYILGSQQIFPRKSFGIVHYCLFSCGFLGFGSVLIAANGLLSSNTPAKIAALNDYLKLEIILQKKFQPDLLNPKFGTLDVIFLIFSSGNFIPYGLFIACIYWDLDGPYFVIEDWAPDPTQRDLSTILIFLGIRTFFLLPGFIETTRIIVISAPLLIYMIVSATQTIRIFSERVPGTRDFFKYYNQLCIICCILEEAIMRLFVVLVTICYLLIIQAGWILICGIGRIQPTIYLMFFVEFILLMSAAVVVFLPQVTVMGNMINGLPHKKKAEMKQKYLESGSLYNKVAVKMANAIQPVRFSYGQFYPLGANFCRNSFGNMMENLISTILLFDFD